LAALGLILALPALACAPLGGGDEAGNENQPATERPPIDATEAPERPTAPATFDLNAANNYGAPEGVTSYRIAVEFRLEASPADQAPEVTTLIGEGARVLEPAAVSFTLRGEDPQAAGGAVDLSYTHLGADEYVVLPEAGCIVRAADSANIPFGALIESGSFLGGIAGASLQERDVEVNGVSTNHYLFDESALPQDGGPAGTFSNVTGHIFVARDGGYLVRLELDGTGRFSGLGSETVQEALLHYVVNFYDFNADIDITPPAGCQAAASSYPILDDATDLNTSGGFTSYRSSVSFSDALAFYYLEMPALGWTLAHELADPPSALLTFQRDDQNVTVSIAPNAEGEGVAIVILALD
jgi:hypothetical protein